MLALSRLLAIDHEIIHAGLVEHVEVRYGSAILLLALREGHSPLHTNPTTPAHRRDGLY